MSRSPARRRSGEIASPVDKVNPTETHSITFEWPLHDLKQHFDSSTVDTKSKVIKSVPFGQGRWTVLFYAQSGSQQFCSLYLNAEPTLEEKNQNKSLGRRSSAPAALIDLKLRVPTKPVPQTKMAGLVKVSSASPSRSSHSIKASFSQPKKPAIMPLVIGLQTGAGLNSLLETPSSTATARYSRLTAFSSPSPSPPAPSVPSLCR